MQHSPSGCLDVKDTCTPNVACQSEKGRLERSGGTIWPSSQTKDVQSVPRRGQKIVVWLRTTKIFVLMMLHAIVHIALTHAHQKNSQWFG